MCKSGRGLNTFRMNCKLTMWPCAFCLAFWLWLRLRDPAVCVVSPPDGEQPQKLQNQLFQRKRETEEAREIHFHLAPVHPLKPLNLRWYPIALFTRGTGLSLWPLRLSPGLSDWWVSVCAPPLFQPWAEYIHSEALWTVRQEDGDKALLSVGSCADLCPSHKVTSVHTQTHCLLALISSVGQYDSS